MNDFARTTDPRDVGEFDRRVYRLEFRRALGYSDTWFREQVRRGKIPPGRRDEGGKRDWWYASEVRAILAKPAASAEQAAA